MSMEEGDGSLLEVARPSRIASPLQKSRSLLIAGGVLPRAPLSQEPSSRDGHLSRLLLSPLAVCSSLRRFSLALALSLSLVLLAGTLGQHPRYTATRSGVAALASSPAVSARRRNSFLPACLPACYLPVYPPLALFSLFPLSTLSFILSHPP